MRQATVIGAFGFIGRHLSRHLQRQGFDVHEASRDERSWPDGSLGHVFYCAGLTADFAQRPHDTVDAHVALLDRVLRQQRFASLVYLSSTRLYDGIPIFEYSSTSPKYAPADASARRTPDRGVPLIRFNFLTCRP